MAISSQTWSDQCREFYAKVMGRPGVPPGQYFRLLLVGYAPTTFLVNSSAIATCTPDC
jgi:hypothetical protein